MKQPLLFNILGGLALLAGILLIPYLSWATIPFYLLGVAAAVYALHLQKNRQSLKVSAYVLGGAGLLLAVYYLVIYTLLV